MIHVGGTNPNAKLSTPETMASLDGKIKITGVGIGVCVWGAWVPA